MSLHDSSAHVSVGNNTIQRKIRKLPLFWIIRVELCCFSDRFCEIHQPTSEHRTLSQKKTTVYSFFLIMVFDRTTVFQITANFKWRLMAKQCLNKFLSRQRDFLRYGQLDLCPCRECHFQEIYFFFFKSRKFKWICLYETKLSFLVISFDQL